MGGRAEGMAGSFSAVADDASFIEYNPAGSSMLKKSELAFFHNNWIADTKLEGAVFTFRLGDLGLAAGGTWLYTPFTEYNLFGDRVSKGYYSEAAAMLNLSYNFFSGYYFSGISAGLNLKGAFRFVPDFTDADDQENSQGQLVSGSGASQSAAMAMADIGLLTRFNFLKFYNSRERNFSLALVCRNLGPPALDDPLPTAVGAGLSWKPLRPILLSFDYIVPLNLQDLSLSEKPYWAGGISAAVTDFLSMRAGLQFKTGNLRITVGSAIVMEKLSLELNYTLDLLTELRPLSRVSLGLRFDLGDRGRQQLADRVDSLYLAGLDAYALENFDEARSLWEEALALNPRFDPARESLDILRRTLELRKRIDEMQRLDF
jgi:tetratricopeptide (TPR) repeat protein